MEGAQSGEASQEAVQEGRAKIVNGVKKIYEEGKALNEASRSPCNGHLDAMRLLGELDWPLHSCTPLFFCTSTSATLLECFYAGSGPPVASVMRCGVRHGQSLSKRRPLLALMMLLLCQRESKDPL